MNKPLPVLVSWSSGKDSAWALHTGENGEFHTCGVDGPMFSAPIEARPGRVAQREIALTSGQDGDEMVNPVYAYTDVVRA